MHNHGAAACAAILVLAAGASPAAAQMQRLGNSITSSTEVVVDTRSVDWSDPAEVERVHQKIQVAAGRLCDVPSANSQAVRRCVAQTVEDAVRNSGSAALRLHWQNCQDRARS